MWKEKNRFGNIWSSMRHLEINDLREIGSEFTWHCNDFGAGHVSQSGEETVRGRVRHVCDGAFYSCSVYHDAIGQANGTEEAPEGGSLSSRGGTSLCKKWRAQLIASPHGFERGCRRANQRFESIFLLIGSFGGIGHHSCSRGGSSLPKNDEEGNRDKKERNQSTHSSRRDIVHGDRADIR